MAQDRTQPGLTFQARAEIDKYLAAYAKDPKSRVFAALAEAYRRAGMLPEAIKVAEEGLRHHPNLPSALVTLGRAYFDSGEPAKARALLERVAQQSPDNLAAQRTLAEIYEQAGETDLARRAYQAILRANPADPEAQKRLQAITVPASPRPEPEPVRPAEKVASPPTPAAPEPPSSISAPAVSASAPLPSQEKTPPAKNAGVPAAPAAVPPPVPAVPTGTLSEQEKMDLFFETVDVTRPAPASPSLEYQVKSASEVFADLEAERKRSPITTETLARLLLKQGYPDKARVIFEEILAGDPSRRDLVQEVAHLRQQLGLPPLEVSSLSKPPAAPKPPSVSTPAAPRPLSPRSPRPSKTAGAPASSPVKATSPAAVKARAPAVPSAAATTISRTAAPRSGPPSQAEKIEVLKGVLAQLKKGKQ